MGLVVDGWLLTHRVVRRAGATAILCALACSSETSTPETGALATDAGTNLTSLPDGADAGARPESGPDAESLQVDGAMAPDVLVPKDLIAGVHTPLPIDPDVSIPHNHWLLDAYRTVLGREHDAGGYKTNFILLQSGSTREEIMTAITSSQEFKSNADLSNRASYVTRLYQVLLKRSPAPDELTAQLASLRNADGSGAGNTWEQELEALYASPEYKAKNCQTSYYTLGAPVNPGALLLHDLFDGKARLQTTVESEPVNLKLPSALHIWDQKLPVLKNPQGAGFIGFTRAEVVDSQFTIMLLSSSDAVSFTEVGPIFDRASGQTFYDPHVAMDNGVCPGRYVMAMECIGHEGASLCVSESTTPGWAETWTLPSLLVDGCNGNQATSVCHSAAAQSASTGVTLIDGKQRYAAWTQVYDGVGANDPQAHTYSQGITVNNFDAYWGTVTQGLGPIYTMMSAEPHPLCTDVWDCNNRDKQDWKREGSHFYALYNGANFYRCEGTWGVSVGRSTQAVTAEYVDRLPLARGIAAERNDTCGISYPVLNVIGGELFVYFAYYPSNVSLGANRTMRARLVSAQ